MTNLDWNLLPSLDALLAERSVSRAAERVGTTVPTMSRTLARLRVAFADPLLVRAGRELVPTPLATALGARVGPLTAEARSLLAGGAAPPLAVVERTLRIRTNSGAAGPWTRPLVDAVRARAPRVTLAFLAEGDERPDDLRDGRVDLDVGVHASAPAEFRTQTLYRDRFVCVVRRGHPLTRGRRTAARVARFDHVGVSRRGRFHGPIDAALRELGLGRNVVATVATSTAAAIAVAGSPWITALPGVLARHYAELLPLAWFDFPFELPPITVAQTWHPRFDVDPVHRLARECLASIVRGRAAPRVSAIRSCPC